VKVQISIELEINREEFKSLVKTDPLKAGKLLDTELKEFDRYLDSKGTGMMARHERDLLREYLGRKLIAVD
jgi:hypothetical protein